jgi:hypothetical protein
MASITTGSQPTATNADRTGDDSSSSPSSPLLFFVALGFGVVFTNLWYIHTYLTLELCANPVNCF